MKHRHAGNPTVRCCLTGLALALLAWAPAAQAHYSRADGPLSPRLAAFGGPALRSASDARQSRAVGLPVRGPASLVREGRRLLVEVRFRGGLLSRLDELRAAGARVLSAARRYQTATVAVEPGDLSRLRSVPGLIAAREVVAPAVAAAPCAGTIVSEGDGQLGAALARADFGLDGSGVTVGILSDSFESAPSPATTAAQDVFSGDLPGAGNPCGNPNPVDVLVEFSGPSSEATDEGRAMAQIVHDLAPGASIDFATAEGGEEDFAEQIKALAAAGASVIVDDIAYFEEPFFQNGPVAVAVEEVVAQGVTYLTAAGNDNLFEGENEIASWETKEFRDSNECPPLLEASAFEPDHCLDFNPAAGPPDDTFGITVEPEDTLIVDVQWAEPLFGVKADLDAYLLDAADNPLSGVEGGTSNSVGKGNDGEGEPVELLGWENETAAPVEVHLAVNRCFSTEPLRKEEKGCNPFASETAKPRVKVLLAENGSGVTATEYPKSSGGDVVGPTIYGHAGAPGAIAVGAVPVTNSDLAEPYTSRGPVTHYFESVAGKTPAAKLTPPQTIAKPDLAATDCGRTTFFFETETPNLFRFCGTSAAAPHAAAVVALAQQANPSATQAQIRAGLSATANAVGPYGPNVVGAGLVDAYGAIDEIALPPKIAFVEPPSVTNDPTPSISFTANRPVVFSCAFDADPQRPCASPVTPEGALPDGPHRLLVRGVDLSGRLGQGEARFTVDTVPPRTFFAARPRKTLRTRARRARAVFRFRSDDEGAGFICRVDGGLFHFCPDVVSRRFGAGVHVMRVKAFDVAGNVDPTAAAYRFRVRRVGIG